MIRKFDKKEDAVKWAKSRLSVSAKKGHYNRVDIHITLEKSKIIGGWIVEVSTFYRNEHA